MSDLNLIPLTSTTFTFFSSFTYINNSINNIITNGEISGSTLVLTKFDGSALVISGFTSESISGLTYSSIITALGYIPYNSNISGFTTSSFTESNYYKLTNPNNYISAITFNNVVNALGYTPLSSSTSSGLSGITSINNQIDSLQLLVTGNTGNDFNIYSNSGIHTFNFPDSSDSNRGLLTSNDWNNFNNKNSYSGLTVSGDVTGLTSNSLLNLTLNNVTSGQTIGSSTQMPVITYDNKGRIISSTTSSVNTKLKFNISGATINIGNNSNIDYYYFCLGNNSLTLPSAINNNCSYTIHVTNGSTTIYTSETINDSPNIVINTPYTSRVIISNDIKYVII